MIVGPQSGTQLSLNSNSCIPCTCQLGLTWTRMTHWWSRYYRNDKCDSSGKVISIILISSWLSLSLLWASQSPCCKDTQAALWRGPRGKELRRPAIPGVSRTWGWIQVLSHKLSYLTSWTLSHMGPWSRTITLSSSGIHGPQKSEKTILIIVISIAQLWGHLLHSKTQLMNPL